MEITIPLNNALNRKLNHQVSSELLHILEQIKLILGNKCRQLNMQNTPFAYTGLTARGARLKTLLLMWRVFGSKQHFKPTEPICVRAQTQL